MERAAPDADPDADRSSLVVAVLAGGSGTRLGGAKATVELCGRPLISYPLEAAARAGLPVLVVARADTVLPPLQVTVLIEPERHRHPLWGVVAALASRRPGGGAVLAVGCDMPFLTAELLRRLVRAPGEPVATRVAGRLQPLPARYGQRHADALERAAAGNRSMSETLDRLDPVVLEGSALEDLGDPRRLLFSVNTPEDLELAAGWISR
jgi:molybdopterin-guanine dinucleotide biosynthesis protein A